MENKEKKHTDEKMPSLGDMIGGRIIFEGVDEYLERKVSKLGNSGHISIPSKHIGKVATITIWNPKFKKEEEEKVLFI